MRNYAFLWVILTSLGAILLGLNCWSCWWWLVIMIVLINTWVGYDLFQTKHAIVRNFPVLGRMRYLAEWMRPKVLQYFVESDTDGTPLSRVFRSIVYQRAKKVLDTAPFGTQMDTYREGYEWVNHSIAALDPHDMDMDPRVTIGGRDCVQPYSASLLNVSAMSYGSLSRAAIAALNGGAVIGNFAHNTGEGGISTYHTQFNGDLIYQIGTGYFGARDKDGRFSPEEFKKRASLPSVKMIEIKLSQGAKPGHGGILPAKKATPEIAEIRNIEPYKDVISPPFHRAFSTPIGLLEFIKQCRDLSGGKPVGFKLCIGHPHEFIAICKAMVKTGIKPDFIAVDGGEGGTGAAPLEFTNSIGTPYLEGLAFVYDTLIGFDLKKEIQIIAAGKIMTGFHMFRAIAMGADICYSARAMMLALGCIQALECNRNTCPVGVATQNESLVKGLVVKDKKVRVANYHRETVESFVEILAATGMKNSDQVNRAHIRRRMDTKVVKTYDELFPYIPEGCLLDRETVPKKWQQEWNMAVAESFTPKFTSVYIDED